MHSCMYEIAVTESLSEVTVRLEEEISKRKAGERLASVVKRVMEKEKEPGSQIVRGTASTGDVRLLFSFFPFFFLPTPSTKLSPIPLQSHFFSIFFFFHSNPYSY